MSDLETKEYIELLRLRAANRALANAVELFVKQWNACGPNSDFGRYFGNVRVAAEAAIKHAEAAIKHAEDQAGLPPTAAP